jgi:hypothetical protein
MPDSLNVVQGIKRISTAIKEKREEKKEDKKPRVTRQKISDYHLDYDKLAAWLKTRFPGFEKEIDAMENVSRPHILFTEMIAHGENRGTKSST